jgi:hypothetical protein
MMIQDRNGPRCEIRGLLQKVKAVANANRWGTDWETFMCLTAEEAGVFGETDDAIEERGYLLYDQGVGKANGLLFVADDVVVWEIREDGDRSKPLLGQAAMVQRKNCRPINAANADISGS